MGCWARARVALSITCVLATSACSDTSSLGPGSGGSSGSGSNGQSAYHDPVCDSMCQDYLTSAALNDTVWLIYNQNIAGQPVGTVDVQGNCPLGGTAHVTGTTALATDGTSTVHLKLQFVTCKKSSSTYSLAFNGTVSIDGTFNNGTSGAHEFKSLTTQASALVVTGSLKLFDEPSIEQTCDYAATEQFSEGQEHSNLDGAVCGREFSSSTAFDTSVGNSGAGNGAGNGSSGNTGGKGDAAVGGIDPDAGTGLSSGSGLCINADEGGCHGCTIGSAANDCAGDETCCEANSVGFCTNFALGACLPCVSSTECDPGQVCCF